MLGYMTGSYPQHIVAVFVVYGDVAIGKVYTKQVQYITTICLANICFKNSYHTIEPASFSCAGSKTTWQFL